MRGFEGQQISSLPPDELGTEVNHVDSPPCLTEPNKDPGQKDVREFPWWAVPCAYGHVSVLGGVNAVPDSTERVVN